MKRVVAEPVADVKRMESHGAKVIHDEHTVEQHSVLHYFETPEEANRVVQGHTHELGDVVFFLRSRAKRNEIDLSQDSNCRSTLALF